MRLLGKTDRFLLARIEKRKPRVPDRSDPDINPGWKTYNPLAGRSWYPWVY